MLTAVPRVQYGRELIHVNTDLLSKIDIPARQNISTRLVGRQLQQLYQMEPLQIGIVIIVQLVREEQTEVLVAPSQVAYVRCLSVHVRLETLVCFVGCGCREGAEKFD